MSPRRRLVAIAALVLASMGGAAVASAAEPGQPVSQTSGENRYGDWWCIWVEDLKTAVCQGDPLPKRLPLPEDRPRL